MLQKRAQGRPGRGNAEVGSQRIVEGARAALRARRSGDVTRKEIAQFAGVTPALVSYYFRDQLKLLEAATVPLIQSYADQLKAIIQSDRSLDDKLHDVIVLLLQSHEVDRRVFETYREVVAPVCRRDGDDLLAMMHDDLEIFLRAWLGSKGSQVSARFLTQAAWGICNQLAWQVTSPEFVQSLPEAEEKPVDNSVLIFNLLKAAPQQVARA